MKVQSQPMKDVMQEEFERYQKGLPVRDPCISILFLVPIIPLATWQRESQKLRLNTVHLILSPLQLTKMLILKILHHILIKRKKPYLLIIWLSGVLTRLLRIKCYCTLCGGWFDPIVSDYIEEEKACDICWQIAQAEVENERRKHHKNTRNDG